MRELRHSVGTSDITQGFGDEGDVIARLFKTGIEIKAMSSLV